MNLLVLAADAQPHGDLQRWLSDAGHAVDVVASPEAAQQRARAADYDVVVVDAGTPSTGGLSFCVELRAAECWTPVLLLSDRDAVADRVLGLQAGADDYLVTPFAFPELLARLRALARRGRRA